MKRSKEQLVAKLKAEGLRFSEFTLTHEGDYAVADADWNYKDVPHLHFVHELVEATIALVEDDKIVTVNMQKVFGITLPLTVCNYQAENERQVYFTTWLFFALIVETGYERLAENRTRVHTTYAIGAPALLRWCVPFIRWTIKRNYKNLMSTDIPMRERRGRLRSWGYSFKRTGEQYSFEQTMDIHRCNVMNAATSFSAVRLDLSEVLPGDGQYYVGRSDHLGLQLRRSANRVEVFPRMCVHEGAELDGSGYCEGKIRCPWHGRAYSPLAVFDLSRAGAQKAYTDYHEMELVGNVLALRPRADLERAS